MAPHRATVHGALPPSPNTKKVKLPKKRQGDCYRHGPDHGQCGIRSLIKVMSLTQSVESRHDNCLHNCTPSYRWRCVFCLQHGCTAAQFTFPAFFKKPSCVFFTPIFTPILIFALPTTIFSIYRYRHGG